MIIVLCNFNRYNTKSFSHCYSPIRYQQMLQTNHLETVVYLFLLYIPILRTHYTRRSRFFFMLSFCNFNWINGESSEFGVNFIHYYTSRSLVFWIRVFRDCNLWQQSFDYRWEKADFAVWIHSLSSSNSRSESILLLFFLKFLVISLSASCKNGDCVYVLNCRCGQISLGRQKKEDWM